MSQIEHIYLSPHFDDVVLSCGGQIAERRMAQQPVSVAIVFGGEPNYDKLSPFAQEVHSRPHATERLMNQRWQEEQRALSILQATPRPGSFLDCIYRMDGERTRWLYDSQEALFGEIDPVEEEDLLMEVTQSIVSLAPEPEQCVLYAPLAIGNHVDHQVVHRAAKDLQHGGYRIRYYEDYPYVVREAEGLTEALARWGAGGQWHPAFVLLNDTSLRRKIEAIKSYRTQHAVLFPDPTPDNLDPIASTIRDYAIMVGQSADVGRLAERLWDLR
jgi:LmbE family N-acetylglucosaminyl deacetylase